MGKSTPTPPAPTDYSKAVVDQGKANVDSALKTSYLSNSNYITPYGKSNTTWGSALDSNGNVILDANGNPEVQATVNQTLTPEAQKTLEAQQRVQLGLANLGELGTNTASKVLSTPFEYKGPDIQTSLGPQKDINYGVAGDAFGLAGGGPAADFYGLASGIDTKTYGAAQRSLDLSDVAKMPVNAGMTGQQAILSRLQPQIQQEKAALDQQLANQGITPGSEAYNNAMRTQGQQANDLYTQAALQGINLDTAANQQGYNQALSTAGLYNQGLGQDFGQGLAATGLTNASIGQNFGQGQAAQRLMNEAIGQNFDQATTSAGFYNNAQNQGFNQNLQGAQFGNTAVQQSLAKQLQLRNQPLNEINALMSSSQIQTPTFGGYTGSNVNAAPVFQGASAAGKEAMDIYGNKIASSNADKAAVASVLGAGAGALGMYYSDIRLKSNIVRIGDHPLGIGIYEYDIDGHRDVGVMAQEVLDVKPEAVIHRPDGYLMVNYGAL